MVPNLGSIENAVSTMLVFVLLINSAQAANTTNNVDGVDIVDGVDSWELSTAIGVYLGLFSTIVFSGAQMCVNRQNRNQDIEIARQNREKDGLSADIDAVAIQNRFTDLEEKVESRFNRDQKGVESRFTRLQEAIDNRLLLEQKLKQQIEAAATAKFNKEVELKLLENPHIMDKALASIEIGYIAHHARMVKTIMPVLNVTETPDDLLEDFRNGGDAYKMVLKRGGLDMTLTNLSLTKDNIVSEIEALLLILQTHFRFNICGKYFKLGKCIANLHRRTEIWKEENKNERTLDDLLKTRNRGVAINALVGPINYQKIETACHSSDPTALIAVCRDIVRDDIRLLCRCENSPNPSTTTTDTTTTHTTTTDTTTTDTTDTTTITTTDTTTDTTDTTTTDTTDTTTITPIFSPV